ncbi:CD1247 N-terminal domain-containing protein [Dethiothermospora halolimnae]|uniref:CD1247 N-terminal domain-containing protein n=1 Tax=Dethiothermospora halolimnae TaxID=3114390 RepID=UPI003CCBB619
MEHLYEKISYLTGLAEGLGIDNKSKEGKLLLHIIDTLEDFADTISELSGEQEELSDYIDYIDEDLADVEDEVYENLDYEYEDDIDYIEMECPHCKETVYLDKNLLDEDAVCPNCLETIVCDCVEE